jgi:ABC-type transport system involved in multi-copper enzyme maturation permease subunit
MALSLVVGEWSMGQQAKVIKDIGLSAVSLFGLFIALFIGIRLIVQELDRRTIAFLASKPIRRWEIVVGKFFGLGFTLAFHVVVMTAALLIAAAIMEKRLDMGLIPAVILLYIEILLMVGFSLFFSSLVSPTLAALFTLIIYVTGHLSGFLRDYTRLYPDRGFHAVFRILYRILPNLENLNLKEAAVQNTAASPHAFWFGLVYGVSYLVVVLVLTAWIFERKEFE